jgi:hypothetical protein
MKRPMLFATPGWSTIEAVVLIAAAIFALWGRS